MAVARIKASPDWFRSTSDLVRGDVPAAAREMVRAIDRPGLLAELGADEVRVLSVLLPDDPLITEALRSIESSEIRENVRVRRVRIMMDERRAGR